jgi:hypothetical protein
MALVPPFYSPVGVLPTLRPRVTVASEPGPAPTAGPGVATATGWARRYPLLDLHVEDPRPGARAATPTCAQPLPAKSDLLVSW